MRSRSISAFAGCLLLLAGSVRTAEGRESAYATLSAGWSWPVGGPIEESYLSGYTMAGSFRTPIEDNFLYGLEVGYSWFGLDTDHLANENPSSTFSGGDLGLLHITTENDYLIGDSDAPIRPFINTGLGFWRSFIEDAIRTTGANRTTFDTGVYEGSFFGFHAGVGVLITGDRLGARIDANYHHLFAAGKNLEFFPVRLGLVYYPGD